MKTVLEIWKKKQEQTTPQSYNSLFPPVQLAEDFTFLSQYYTDANVIDKSIVNRFNSFMHYNSFIDDDVTAWDDMFKGYAIMNASNFQRIYDALLAEYNPIENYDKQSEIKTTYEGKESNELSKVGTETSETSFEGKETNTTAFDGKETSTHSTPESGYEDTVENQISPEDTSNYIGTEKTITKTAQRQDTDTTEFDERTDTNTREFDERKDTTSLSFDERKDTNTKTFEDRVDTITEHTHGNVGTTQNQQMLSAEVSLRLSTSFYPMIFSQFIKEHCFI